MYKVSAHSHFDMILVEIKSNILETHLKATKLPVYTIALCFQSDVWQPSSSDNLTNLESLLLSLQLLLSLFHSS